MRISDWSSDVCSSDLFVHRAAWRHRAAHRLPAGTVGRHGRLCLGAAAGDQRTASGPWSCGAHRSRTVHDADTGARYAAAAAGIARNGQSRRAGSGRSEEHTSELQSLMRISYAVFCLKKKKKQTTTWKRHKTGKNTTNIRNITTKNE